MPPSSTTPTTATAHEQEETAAAAASAAVDEEEDLLRDVLEELDRERSKRAELESKIRLLTEEHAHERREPATQAVTGKGNTCGWIASLDLQIVFGCL